MAIQADDVTKLLKKMEGTVVKVGKNGKTALSKGFRSVDEAMEASEKVSAQVVEEEANIRKAINQEQRRLRRLEIENNPNASPEARAKATADLDRPHSKNMTAEEWKAKEQARKENSQAGKDYRQKQADLERQAKQTQYESNQQKKDEIRQRISDSRTRRQQKQDAAIDKEADLKMEKSAKMEQMKEDARKRIEANREGYQRTRETRMEREIAQKENAAAYEKQKKANDLKEKIKQRRADRAAGNEVQYEGDLGGMGGEKSRSYSQEDTNKLVNEARQATGGSSSAQPSSNSSAFADEANNAEKLRQANMGVRERIGSKINEAKKNAGEYIYDRTLNRKNITAERRAYNNEMLSNPDAMISSNGEYLKMRSQARAAHGEVVTNDDIRNVKIGGSGRQSGVGGGSEAAHAGYLADQGDAANDIATKGFLDYAGDAVNWATQDMNHAVAVAGAGVGIGLLGSELLDES